ncbi:MAG: shikimate dehydrogenase [Bacillota bacterium]
MADLRINGETRVTGIFGDPVAHTLSPAMHNSAFAALGLNFVYLPFHVTKDGLGAAIAAVRALGIAGVNITVPHKEDVLPYLDEISEDARIIGAVNTIVNRGGRLTGYNTDGSGFLRAIREEGFETRGADAVVLGAGGAARAVCVALGKAGVRRITIFNRTYRRASSLAEHVAKATGAEAEAFSWEELETSGAAAIRAAGIVAQTTSLGMHPQENEKPPVPGGIFHKGQLVVDLVYNPPQTGFLRAAAAGGAATQNGLAMLLHQGAAAFELWTGREAPVEIMRQALMDTFVRRHADNPHL